MISDGSLSQEEIDALLQGADDIMIDQGADTMATPAAPAAAPISSLSPQETSVLTNIASTFAQAASKSLSLITSKTVSVANPRIEVKTPNELLSTLSGKYSANKIDFIEGLIGENVFILPAVQANTIGSYMMGDNADVGDEVNALYSSAISEAMGQMTAAIIKELYAKTNINIRNSPPDSIIVNSPSDFKLPAGDSIVKITYDINIEGSSSGTFIHLMGLPLAQSLINTLSGPTPMPQQPMGATAMPQAMPMGMPQQGMMPGMQQPMMGYAPVQQQFTTQPASFSDFETAGLKPEQAKNISLLMDVPMTLTVELGRTEKLVKDILSLGEGSIIELDKLAGEPVDLLVNGKLIAKGEVVVIDENFGVRVTDIVSPMERLASLQ